MKKNQIDIMRKQIEKMYDIADMISENRDQYYKGDEKKREELDERIKNFDLKFRKLNSLLDEIELLQKQKESPN